MTNASNKYKQLTCTDVASLLDAQLIGEALSPTEQETLDQHLSECAACTEFMELTQGLSAFAPNESMESMERNLQLVTSEFFKARPRRRKWMAIGLAAAAVVLTGVLLAIFPAAGPSTPEVAWKCVSTGPTEVVSGVWLSHCENHPPKTRIDGQHNLTVSMQEGAVGISADPNRIDKGAISVETPDGEVRVLGTIFTVVKEKDDSRVEVFRGKVKVTPRDSGPGAFQVTEGHGAWFSTPQRYVLPGSRRNALKEKLLAVTYPQPEAEMPNANSAVPAVAENGDMTPSGQSTAKVKKSSRHGRANTESLDDLLVDARNCLIAKQWECAATKYRTILTHYPTQWEASSAYISLAKIELRHLGKPVQAKKHFATYRKRYPTGPLVSDAFFGIAECERQLGNADNELKILRSFVQNHPASPMVVKANKRIKELQ